MADQGEQVAGDVGAGDGLPARARLAVPAQVHGDDAVVGLRQPRGQVPVDLPVVADAVRQHDERAVTVHVVGDLAAVDMQELGHVSLCSALG